MKIYLTGTGLLTPIGNDLETFWENILNPKEELLNKEYTELNFTREEKKIVRRMNRISKGAFLTSRDALKNSIILKETFEAFDIGTVFYSITASIESVLEFNSTVYEKGTEYASSTVFSSTVNNACLGGVTVNFKVKGFSTMLNTMNYLGYAILALRSNRAKGILVGGFEAYNETYYTEMKKFRYIEEDSSKQVVPLNSESETVRFKEGMSTFLLQRYDSPYLKEETILAEMISYSGIAAEDGVTLNTEKKMSPEGFEKAMKIALDRAGLDYKDIDGIIMAAGGNKNMDIAEVKAIKNVFKDMSNKISITTIKDVVGETGSGSLNLNIMSGALTLRDGIMPGNKFIKDMNPEVDINIIKENTKGDYEYLMINSVCFIGGIVTHIIKKYKR